MFICTELIEETERPPGLIFSIKDIFGQARKSSRQENVHTFDGVNTYLSHLSKCEKSHKC